MAFSDLGTHILVKIMTMVSPQTFISLLHLSKKYKQLNTDKHFWKYILDTEFPNPVRKMTDDANFYKMLYACLKFKKYVSTYAKNKQMNLDPKNLAYTSHNSKLAEIDEKIKVLQQERNALLKINCDIHRAHENDYESLSDIASKFRKTLELTTGKHHAFLTVSHILDYQVSVKFAVAMFELPRAAEFGHRECFNLGDSAMELTPAAYIKKFLTDNECPEIFPEDEMILCLYLKEAYDKNETPTYIIYFKWMRNNLFGLIFTTSMFTVFNKFIKTEYSDITIETIYEKYGLKFKSG
jgi:hypothetical protein